MNIHIYRFAESIAELSMAIISNPCNHTEILIFGCHGDGMNAIHVYNRYTNKIKKNKVGLIHKEDYQCIASYAVGGNTKHTLIILWRNVNSGGASFYGIFNCKTMQFDTIYKNFGIASHHCVWSGQAVHRVNNWLFRIIPNEIIVYDICDQNCPKEIKTNIHVPSDYLRGRELKSIAFMEKDPYIVKIVLFGTYFTFNQSFYKVKINLKNFDIETSSTNEWCMADDMAKKYNVHKSMTGFSYHWYKSRYLMIVGGKHGCVGHDHELDQIICFDYKEKKMVQLHTQITVRNVES